MTHLFDHSEPPDSQSILFRVIEGLAVVAFVIAVIVWQTDGTLEAAKRFAAGFSGERPAQQPARVAAAPPSDIKILDLQAQPSGPEEPSSLDPVQTASISPVPASARPSARPAEPVNLSPYRTGWIAACDNKLPSDCIASQSLGLAGDPALETSWTIEKGEGGLFAVWTTPTGVVVSRGMTLTMGNGKPKTVPFDACGPHSCMVRAKLAPEFIGLLKGSPRISTEIVLRGGKSVTFNFLPDGLVPALQKLGV